MMLFTLRILSRTEAIHPKKFLANQLLFELINLSIPIAPCSIFYCSDVR